MSKGLINGFLATALIATASASADIYVNSQVTSSVGFLEMSVADGQQLPLGSYSLLGVEFKQALGWKNWVNAEISGGYAASVGGVNRVDLDSVPSTAVAYDLGARLYSSIPCDSCQETFIEPLIGMFALKLNTKSSGTYFSGPDHEWIKMRFWGPMAGLYMRMIPMDKFVLRAGGAWLFPRLWSRHYPVRGENIQRIRTQDFRAHRGGVLAELSFSYQARSWFSVYFKLDHQVYAVGGGALVDLPGGGTQNGINTTPYLQRSRFVWGTNFTY